MQIASSMNPYPYRDPDYTDVLTRLTAEEIETHLEGKIEDKQLPPVDDADRPQLAAKVWSFSHELARAGSEMHALMGNFYRSAPGRGAPKRERGKPLSAYLLGYAEGLGLQATRNREPSSKSLENCASDAVVEALRRASPDRPTATARSILSSAPKTLSTLEKLAADSNPDNPEKGGRLVEERRRGRSDAIEMPDPDQPSERNPE
jgi:hypothetical protein